MFWRGVLVIFLWRVRVGLDGDSRLRGNDVLGRQVPCKLLWDC